MLSFSSTPPFFENIAYFLTRTSTSLAYRLLKKVVIGKKDTADLLNLCFILIRNLRRVGVLSDEEVDSLLNFMVGSILDRKNPLELIKFALILANQALRKLKDDEVSVYRELQTAEASGRVRA